MQTTVIIGSQQDQLTPNKPFYDVLNLQTNQTKKTWCDGFFYLTTGLLATIIYKAIIKKGTGPLENKNPNSPHNIPYAESIDYDKYGNPILSLKKD
ncbi:hypothetical protein EKK58_03405 [Candidatus Dependentiae bacterium]|nr:MAG: hypothetical protein EKK58_03405 [Candidatus Dependentiae bacterium]